MKTIREVKIFNNGQLVGATVTCATMALLYGFFPNTQPIALHFALVGAVISILFSQNTINHEKKR